MLLEKCINVTFFNRNIVNNHFCKFQSRSRKITFIHIYHIDVFLENPDLGKTNKITQTLFRIVKLS